MGSYSRFMGLPSEVREIIYEYTFLMNLRMRRVPDTEYAHTDYNWAYHGWDPEKSYFSLCLDTASQPSFAQKETQILDSVSFDEVTEGVLSVNEAVREEALGVLVRKFPFGLQLTEVDNTYLEDMICSPHSTSYFKRVQHVCLDLLHGHSPMSRKTTWARVYESLRTQLPDLRSITYHYIIRADVDYVEDPHQEDNIISPWAILFQFAAFNFVGVKKVKSDGIFPQVSVAFEERILQGASDILEAEKEEHTLAAAWSVLEEDWEVTDASNPNQIQVDWETDLVERNIRLSSQNLYSLGHPEHSRGQFEPFFSLPTEIRYMVYELAMLGTLEDRGVRQYGGRHAVQEYWNWHSYYRRTLLFLFLDSGVQPNLRQRLTHTIATRDLEAIGRSLVAVNHQVRDESLRILTTTFTLHFDLHNADPIWHNFPSFGCIPRSHLARRFQHLSFNRPSAYFSRQGPYRPKSLRKSFPAVRSITLQYDDISLPNRKWALILDASHIFPRYLRFDWRNISDNVVSVLRERMHQAKPMLDVEREEYSLAAAWEVLEGLDWRATL
ncbi:MAG: hypothetical protein M1831_004695 [Alyxoria varia]|nr:MAG: hypothetical protein M1831_004695 [Alyxoria varia]